VLPCWHSLLLLLLLLSTTLLLLLLLLLLSLLLLLLSGANPVIVDTGADSGFIMSAEQLEAALTPKSRLLILCTPSNPTGKCWLDDFCVMAGFRVEIQGQCCLNPESNREPIAYAMPCTVVTSKCTIMVCVSKPSNPAGTWRLAVTACHVMPCMSYAMPYIAVTSRCTHLRAGHLILQFCAARCSLRQCVSLPLPLPHFYTQPPREYPHPQVQFTQGKRWRLSLKWWPSIPDCWCCLMRYTSTIASDIVAAAAALLFCPPPKVWCTQRKRWRRLLQWWPSTPGCWCCLMRSTSTLAQR
jgi:hypothetical protein